MAIEKILSRVTELSTEKEVVVLNKSEMDFPMAEISRHLGVGASACAVAWRKKKAWNNFEVFEPRPLNSN